MEFLNNYFISQILVIISTIFISITYFTKKRSKVLIIFIFYSCLYGLHYLLLGALTGFLMNIVSIIRNVLFYLNEQRHKENSVLFLLILYIIILLFTLYSYKDIYGIVSMSASLLSTYSVWQKNLKIYRFIAIIVSILFIIYAIHINSLFALITEVILLFAEIIGIFINKKGDLHE